ncbi:MAG: hypothetical protein OXU27_01620 [Candidatus Poribacteria bacterium]|nr:hypothetical protein [Candidatus Poribacteria bacterium]MDE0322464.1 hypothetical protein [Candidatus Poribacteria bacterium]
MELLKKSVQSVIEKDRIGSPVFLRCVLNVADDTVDLLPSLGEAAALANGWMPSVPTRVYAQGGAEATQMTVMVHYVGGQMALVSVNRVDAETAIDIMLVGNKGVIYHETPVGRHYLNAAPPELSGAGELTEAIVQSLESGQPITLEG